MNETTAFRSDECDGPHLNIGNSVSHYRILERLGRGGMGVVYKAEDTRLGRFVALKFLSEALTQDTMALERLRREARAASSLNHPHICAIHDIDEFQAQPFLVMEFLEGQTLSAKIDDRSLELPEILKIARQVTEALQASHEKQIIHRDIKPSNIMITSRGEVKVLDFGLAKITGGVSANTTTGMTEAGTLLGTVHYMSPEQALGHPVDVRSDLFSLGVMLYEMAAGCLPFSGSTAMETINRIVNAEPEAITRLNVNIPPGLERIISKCLEKSADYRFQSAHELLNDLAKSDPDTARLNRRGIRNNLPQQLSRFIGRQGEIAEMQRRLSETRLLTLTGSGGIGKTRLALAVAAESLNAYEDGVWFVELAVLLVEGLVPQTVASAFGLRDERGRSITNTLVDYLKQRNMLLVLDNCEHLVAACAQLADTILRVSPRLRILATSREALSITGETVMRVPPLDEAVELFVDRARLVKPGWEITPQNAPALAKICSRLDGIPLAIELAASRVKVMSVEQIESRLQDRFGLLTGGSRTALPRHQTLRAAIDWSYNLLPEAEQILFSRLSVFSGGWTLEAAETVCSGERIGQEEVLELLSGLVDKSLVIAEDRDGQHRYRFMVTLLEYAQKQLSQTEEGDAMLRRRAAFFTDLAEEGEEKLIGSDQKLWLERLNMEHDNMRVVLNWTSANDPEIGLRLAAALGRFWYQRGYFTEGRSWLAELLAPERSRVEGALRAKALSSLGRLAWIQGDYAVARSYGEQAVSLFTELGNKLGIAGALSTLGNVARLQGDSAAELSFHKESLAICRELGDESGIAVALNNLGIAAEQACDYAAARSHHQESLAIRQEIGDKRGAAVSLDNLGIVAYRQSDYAGARALHEKSLTIRRELGDKQGIASSLNNMGEVVWQQGDYATANSLFKECLALRRELGAKSGIAMSLNNLGDVARRQGDYVSAASLCNEGLALFRELGHKAGIAGSLCSLAEVVRRQGDYAAADALYNESVALYRELGDKHGTAVALNGLGEASRRRGDCTAADSLLRESLEIFRELGATAQALTTVENLAVLALALGQSERAVHLFGASNALRATIAIPRPSDESGEYNHGINAALSALGEQAFAAGWAAGETMSADQAFEYALKV